MKKIGLFIAAALAATTIGVFAPSTASAHTDACAGAGTATLGNGLGLPNTKTSTGFVITLNGVCLPSGDTSLTAAGTVDGACGQSKGAGTAEGHDFVWTSVGTLLVLTGELTGVVTAFADPTRTNNSCVDGSARFFQVQGAGALTVHGGCTTVTNQTPKVAVSVCTAP